MKKYFYVHVLASAKNGTLYIGVTSNLHKRIFEHKDKIKKGFTQKYSVTKLVYYEQYFDNNSSNRKRKTFKKMEKILEAKSD